ncbi:hypothetical protein LCGC14_0984660 [marine sediment metagenome]|uniref:Uncharacterized protein n=1 Tax=marine sediment metagenome TaxID=412755 RepID=A0A0F9QQX3_9ZZZZ
MRLLANGFTTAATTFAGTTAGAQQGFSTHADYTAAGVAGSKGMTIKKIVAFAGGTTAAAGSSGLLKFRYGRSSDAIISTMILMAPAANDALTSVTVGGGQNIVLDGLNIDAGWFDAETMIISAGVGIFVFGD